MGGLCVTATLLARLTLDASSRYTTLLLQPKLPKGPQRLPPPPSGATYGGGEEVAARWLCALRLRRSGRALLLPPVRVDSVL